MGTSFASRRGPKKSPALTLHRVKNPRGRLEIDQSRSAAGSDLLDREIPLSELIAIGRVVWSGFSGCWRWLGAETTISHDAALSNVRHCLNKYALNPPQIVSLQYELISVPLTNMVPEHLPSDGRLEL